MQMMAAADPLVETLAATVTALADGNGVTRDAISVNGTRVDRPMSLVLKVGLLWNGETQTLTGAREVRQSKLCADEAAAAEHLRLRCEALIADTATAESVAKLIRADPHARFGDLADEFEVGAGHVRSHHHSGCERCGTKRKHTCTNHACNGRGTVPCLTCRDGKRQCPACQYGTVHYQESVYDSYSRNTVLVHRQRACGQCGGSGRIGTCYTCGGNMQIQCRTCRGDGWVHCSPCEATGWFTVAKHAWIVGRPTRAPSFPDATPASFVEQVGKLPTRTIHGKHAETRFRFAEIRDGRVLAVFDCNMPHVSVEARFGDLLTQVFEAFGGKATVVRMPTFLDALLRPMERSIGAAVAAGNMDEAVRLAQGARATDDVLQAVSGARGATEEEICARHGGAVSKDTVRGIFDHMGRAYPGLGRASVRRAWLAVSLPVFAAAAALSGFDAGRHLLDGVPDLKPIEAVDQVAVGLGLNVLMATIPVAVAWRLAGSRARRAVRAIVGEGALKRPGQGWWPAAGMALALAACLGGAAATGAVGVLTSPQPPRWRTETRSSSAPLPGGPPGTLEPARGQVRGVPGVYRTQFLLAQLGFLRAEPDGAEGDATRIATAALMRAVPRAELDRRPGADAFEIARAAVRGEFRLVGMPADDSPGLLLSNVIRGNMTAEDADRINRAATTALRSNRYEMWRSTDGKREAYVKVSRPPPSAPKECALIDVELVGERHFSLGPLFCPVGTRWVSRQ